MGCAMVLGFEAVDGGQDDLLRARPRATPVPWGTFDGVRPGAEGGGIIFR